MWIDSYAPDGPGADKVTLNIYFNALAPAAAETHSDPNVVAEIAWFAPEELPESLAFPGHLPAVLRTWRASQDRTPRATPAQPRALPARTPEPTL
jgi:hypothetical protein